MQADFLKALISCDLPAAALKLGIHLALNADEEGKIPFQIKGLIDHHEVTISRSKALLKAYGLIAEKREGKQRFICLAQNLSSNTNTTTTNNSLPKRKKAQTLAEVEVPESISAEVWRQFVTHRKKLRKEMTPYAAQLILNKTIKLSSETGSTPDELLNHAIQRGWQDVFPIRNGSGGAAKPQNESINDLLRKLEG